MAELITRYVKLGIGFVIIWCLMLVYNNMSCRQVHGAEMEPTVAREKYKFVIPTKYKPYEHIVHDDVIYYEFEQSGEGQSTFAARVIGLPGDRIRMERGEVYRNDRKVDQAYVGRAMVSGDTLEEIIVPRDSFFVLMDNRLQCARWDSRGIGPVGMYALTGKIWQ